MFHTRPTRPRLLALGVFSLATTGVALAQQALKPAGELVGHAEPVYAVAFSSDDLFGPSPEGRWTVLLDLFDSYLEPA